mmetsp:Transcript_11343/g.21494  ORF Transcript_11343/g.21494 Transcript_11343/m.21494 type:complete len:200 (+) Transcript_11343:682-1281(+)
MGERVQPHPERLPQRAHLPVQLGLLLLHALDGVARVHELLRVALAQALLALGVVQLHLVFFVELRRGFHVDSVVEQLLHDALLDHVLDALRALLREHRSRQHHVLKVQVRLQHRVFRTRLRHHLARHFPRGLRHGLTLQLTDLPGKLLLALLVGGRVRVGVLVSTPLQLSVQLSLQRLLFIRLFIVPPVITRRIAPLPV